MVEKKSARKEKGAPGLYLITYSSCHRSSAKQFLKLRIDHLQKDIDRNRRELALCWYLLGDTNEAMNHMQHYLAHTDPQSVERRDASDLSVNEFFHHYAMSHTPLIITGLKTTTVKWDLEHIKKAIGHKVAPLHKSVSDGFEWAKLESCGRSTVSDFIEAVKRKESDKRYLFDWSIPLYCSELVNELLIPRYFSDDYLQRTPPGSLYRDSWPSLFIAPAGITSSLHVDTFGSNFWMALFEGRKRWLFFPPEDVPCLYPQYHFHSSDPVFNLSLEDSGENSKGDYPLVAMTHPMECILEPGEVLFVPAGSPHQVENLEASLAISANFVNHSNISLVRDELLMASLIDDRSKELLSSLNALELNIDSNTSIEERKDLKWKEFKMN
uniref:JmjC domain-containing protein n=2 Tax=Amphimedon queenslandica TaxID=400682 RepID=A0A1X7VFD8_AMPQE